MKKSGNITAILAALASLIVITAIHVFFMYLVYVEWVKYFSGLSNIKPIIFRLALFNIIYAAEVCAVICLYSYQSRKKHAENQAKLEKMAYIDAITGGPSYNRFVYQVIESLKNTSAKYAFIRTSPKNFSLINEKSGQHSGDALLKEISDIIAGELKSGEYYCRYNNEDFLLMLRYDTPEELTARLEVLYSEKITKRANEKYFISLLFSIGIYFMQTEDDENRSVEILTDKATLAMKSVERGVGNCKAVYTDKLREDSVLENRLDYEMRSALKNKEFIVHIQPKYNLKTNEIASAEALVRWIHPELGVIQPNSFIPVAERNGMVVDIDFYVMDTVCRKIREWMDRGIFPVPISVNQSRLHLTDENYTDQLIAVLQKYDIPPELIELETTETVFFNDNELMLNVMEQLHKIGFLISMDDFGSGYSSLNMLKEIPVDVLKLDRVFFGLTAETERGKIVIAHIIAMAKALDMVVVAEGVEKQEQADFLRAIGCDMAQGFLFSRPLPIDLFEAEAFGRMEVDLTAFA